MFSQRAPTNPAGAEAVEGEQWPCKQHLPGASWLPAAQTHRPADTFQCREPSGCCSMDLLARDRQQGWMGDSRRDPDLQEVSGPRRTSLRTSPPEPACLVVLSGAQGLVLQLLGQRWT